MLHTANGDIRLDDMAMALRMNPNFQTSMQARPEAGFEPPTNDELRSNPMVQRQGQPLWSPQNAIDSDNAYPGGNMSSISKKAATGISVAGTVVKTGTSVASKLPVYLSKAGKAMPFLHSATDKTARFMQPVSDFASSIAPYTNISGDALSLVGGGLGMINSSLAASHASSVGDTSGHTSNTLDALSSASKVVGTTSKLLVDTGAVTGGASSAIGSYAIPGINILTGGLKAASGIT